MKAIDRLRRDHELFRAKLKALEGMLAIAPETWFVLREVCFTLSRQLKDHIRREETLIAASRKGLIEDGLMRVAVDHHEEAQSLWTINWLLVQEPRPQLKQVRSVLNELMTVLPRHMAEQEAGLFPRLERVLARRGGDVTSVAGQDGAHLNETMTVNFVISRYPRTKAIFEQFFINLSFESYDCLDEVAWRHGMESQELLDRLEGAITPRATREARPPLVAQADRKVVSHTP